MYSACDKQHGASEATTSNSDFSVPLCNFKNFLLSFSPHCNLCCFLLSSLSPVSHSRTAYARQNALHCVQWAGDVGLTSCAALESGNSWEDLTVQFACLWRTKWYDNEYWKSLVNVWACFSESVLPLVSTKFSQNWTSPLFFQVCLCLPCMVTSPSSHYSHLVYTERELIISWFTCIFWSGIIKKKY